MQKIGLVAGSFDPVTMGHAWLISEGARLMDKLYVCIGVNPGKKYYFNEEVREKFVHATLSVTELYGTPVEVLCIPKGLLVRHAKRLGVTHLIRGIRNATDFNYETEMAVMNRKIEPSVQTILIPTPREKSEIASSMVKQLVGLEDDWEQLIAEYVHPSVSAAFRERLALEGA